MNYRSFQRLVWLPAALTAFSCVAVAALLPAGMAAAQSPPPTRPVQDGAAAPGGRPLWVMVTNTSRHEWVTLGLGFDVPPLVEAPVIEVFVGDREWVTNAGRFTVRGQPVSRDNPLRPGELACAGPLAHVPAGSRLTFDQVETALFGFHTVASIGAPRVAPGTVLPFNHVGLSGAFRFLDRSCQPAVTARK